MKNEEWAAGTSEARAGVGNFKTADGFPLKDPDAADLLWWGDDVVSEGAGKDSYDEVFARLGADELSVLDWLSPKGDFAFALRSGRSWHVACQENRFPDRGFLYKIHDASFASLDEAAAWYQGVK